VSLDGAWRGADPKAEEMVARDLREDARVTDKPATYSGDLAHLPAALIPLTMKPRWVVWRWEWRVTRSGGRWTKPPYQAGYPKVLAKSNDSTTWGNYADAVDAVTGGEADGIGFMMHRSEIGAGDLDHCFDYETRTIDPWAEALQDEARGAYVEATVSGKGLRIIGRVAGPETIRR
jgi:primase-polymerase (primpol)-like protein